MSVTPPSGSADDRSGQAPDDVAQAVDRALLASRLDRIGELPVDRRAAEYHRLHDELQQALGADLTAAALTDEALTDGAPAGTVPVLADRHVSSGDRQDP